MKLQDKDGAGISSTSGALDVNIASGTTLDITGDSQDMDSGAGEDNHEVMGIALPASGGHVVGGTSSNPVRTDPTGSTTQPVSGTVAVSAVGGTTTVDGTVTAEQATAASLKMEPTQTTHDSLQCNANMQVGDTDVSATNPVPRTTGVNVTTAVDNQSPAAGATVTSSGVDTTKAVGLVVSVKGTFTAAATGAALIYVYSSPDDTNYDDHEVAYAEIPAPGSAVNRQKSIVVNGAFAYIKVAVKNNDGAEAMSAVYAYVTEKRTQ